MKKCKVMHLNKPLIKTLFIFLFAFCGWGITPTLQAQQENINDLLENFIYYTELGEYEEALPFAQKVYIQATATQRHHQMYYVMVSILAKAYKNVDQLDSAKKYMHKSQRLAKKQFGEYSTQNGETLNLVGSIHQDLLQLDSAEMAYTHAISVLKLAPNSADELISAYNNLADLNQDRGQLNDAMTNYDKALEFCQLQFGKTHNYYPVILSNLATLYGDIGQTQRALVLLDEAINIYQNKGDTNTFSFAQKLSNRSIYNFKLAFYSATQTDVSRALRLLKIPTPSQQLLKATLLNTKSQVLETQGNLTEAATVLQQSMNLVAQIKGTTHPDYLEKANNMGLLLLEMGQTEQAEKLLQQSRNISEERYGADSQLYALFTRSLASVLAASNQPEKAAALKIVANKNLQKDLQEILQFGTEAEKKKFIYDTYHILEVNQSFALQYPEFSAELILSNANLLLSLNGTVLASASHVLQDVRAMQSTEAKNLLETYERIYVEWNQAKESDLNWKKQDSLRVALTKAERTIARMYAQNDGDKFLFATADQIRKKLAKDETAIIYSDFRFHNGQKWTDSTIYAAYVFSAKQKTPTFLYVCSEADLRHVQRQTKPDHLYAYRGAGAVETIENSALNQFYALLISPIEESLANTKKLHFVPSGLLHQIPFAALYQQQNEELCHQYQLYQYISLRSLVQNQSAKNIDYVLLVGGVEFGLYSPQSTTNNAVFGWDYLPGTKKEIDEIANSLQGKNLTVNVVEGYSATEEKLNPFMENCDVFHIATHGFFFPEKRLKPNATKGYSIFQTAEDPLLRNGILLSKANQQWHKTADAIDQTDGILTAAEISMKDLRNTQLVTLSACQTGLGDIDQSEGVYGLQRAFKMAGANYIMASLWQVPDQETAEFMQLFYQHLFQQKNIRQAFIATQRSMQKTYPEEPLKWAAFILTQ